MIIQDITSGSNNLKLDKILMVEYLEAKGVSLSNIKECLRAYEDKEWLNLATKDAFNMMDNETHELIKQTNIELIKAKKLLKKKYPVRYRLHSLIKKLHGY